MSSVILNSLSDFIDDNCVISNVSPNYFYEGRCPKTDELLRLPRTALAEAIAKGLMQHLANDSCYSHEGKMYGILIVELPNSEKRVLKAFSGLLNSQSVVEGWVPPIPGRDEIALEEARTLAELETIKQELITLKQLPERQQYETLSREYEQQLQQMSDRHRHCKYQRHEKRQILSKTLTGEALTIALEQLNEESRRQGIERRQLKQQQNTVLYPLKQQIEVADTRIRELKQRRKALSQQLQTQMHAAYSLTNFSGQSLSLQQLMPGGSMPTGTGDCCAPKLLHYAAIHNLKPVAMAEFWWGLSSVNQDKIQGEFYGACAERCQPLMGFLLSGLQSNPPAPFDASLAPIFKKRNSFFLSKREVGLPISCTTPLTPLSKGGTHTLLSTGKNTLIDANLTPLNEGRTHSLPIARERLGRGKNNSQQDIMLPILYKDEWLIAVDKPAGLLSVPGRYQDAFDSVLSRLRHLLPDGTALMAAHRLDQATSGILLLARDRQTYCQLSQQFQQRQVYKLYEAILSGFVIAEQGIIELPLWGNPENRPYQIVDEERGKPSVTRFQVMAREGDYTRVEFIPLTGRTHQLRVHAADERGLGIPILGDRLYGCRAVTSRLHLHARELHFQHPQSRQAIHLRANTPF